MTREEIMEKYYAKMSYLYKLNIEDLTYRNIFYYTFCLGNVGHQHIKYI